MQQHDYEHGRTVALAAGETEEIAQVFATYYATERAIWQDDMIAKGEEVPAEGLEAALLKETREFPGCYKLAVGKGHGQAWTYAYSRYLQCEYDVVESEEDGYRAVREKSPAVKGAHPAVWHEAKIARLERGPQYADAYDAALVNQELYKPKRFDQYAELVVAQLKAGKSALFAYDYA